MSIYSIKELLTKKNEDESAQKRLEEKQQEIKLKEIEKSIKKIAISQGLNYINLVGFSISPKALKLIEEEKAKKFKVICFFYASNQIRIGTTSPSQEVRKILRDLEIKYHAKAKLYLISPHSFEYALNFYITLPKVIEEEKGLQIDGDKLKKYQEEIKNFREIDNKIKQSLHKLSLTDIVAIILAAAIKAGASDVHIESEEKTVKCRYRIDGILHDVAELSQDLKKRVISRIKILAGLKINVFNKAQDGRFSIFLNNEKINVRVSALPTAFGESVVMRLLMPSVVSLKFEKLGLSNEAYDKLNQEVKRPNGLIVTTGPTGSGKTTTLYAILNKLNTPDKKIITIEDPIEYELKGVNQSQVDANSGYTFSKGLRSIVRQDPDIILVGEIRDLETANIAIQAALTGHLVLSTIHTNDASGTIPRFLSMGVKPFLLAPAINVMIGQRLVRRLCNNCKREAKISNEQMEKIKRILQQLPEDKRKEVDFNNLKFYKSVGCEKCQGIGYKGRIGIYEIMTMNKEVEKLILSGNVSEYDMKDIAIKNGMVTMVQDGLLKALKGITSIDEVFRVSE